MKKEKIKVYIYTRVSTTMQIDGYSLDAQKSRMKSFAEYNDYEIVGEYEDAGKSGKSIEGRTEFNRMMEDIKSGKDGVSFVLVFKLSRFGRNAADVLSTLENGSIRAVFSRFCVKSKFQRPEIQMNERKSSVNHRISNSVVWCGKGLGKAVLSQFFERLTPEQRASIRCVLADGAKWIASCVEEYCPNAERCVDPFHVVSWATEVLDKERRKAWAEANATVKEAQKRKPGRPAKGEKVNPEKKDATALKNLRYVLLKNPEHLSEGQKAQLYFLTKANPMLYRAHLLKERLRLVFQAGPEGVADALKKWMGWAQRCRIPAFVELRKKVKRHFNAIIAAVTQAFLMLALRLPTTRLN